MGIQFKPAWKNALIVTAHPFYAIGIAVVIGLALVMVLVPLRSAGSPDEPAPPVAMM